MRCPTSRRKLEVPIAQRGRGRGVGQPQWVGVGTQVQGQPQWVGEGTRCRVTSVGGGPRVQRQVCCGSLGSLRCGQGRPCGFPSLPSSQSPASLGSWPLFCLQSQEAGRPCLGRPPHVPKSAPGQPDHLGHSGPCPAWAQQLLGMAEVQSLSCCLGQGWDSGSSPRWGGGSVLQGRGAQSC